MPFRSKAQMRKMAVLEREGKIPPGTFREWLSETWDVKRLPERKRRRVRKGRNGGRRRR